MTTAATAAPATAAHKPPTALTTAGIPPPIAVPWAAANKLPAAAVPIPACTTAAIEPIGYKCLDVARGSETGGSIPATGPAALEPITPSATGPGKVSGRHR
jgi:hypothetical protein